MQVLLCGVQDANLAFITLSGLDRLSVIFRLPTPDDALTPFESPAKANAETPHKNTRCGSAIGALKDCLSSIQGAGLNHSTGQNP